MKDTIFEIKQSATRENITFHFQTNDQFDAIKDAIVRKFNNKRRLSTSSSVEGSSPIHLQHHIGGLPSPPVEEKKVIAILPSLKPSKQQESSSSPPLLSSQEIREKIQYLKDEKHRLFQLIKQMMMEEESRKRKAKAEEQSLQQRQAPPLPPQSAPATPPAQQQPKKKSRWGAPAASASASPFYSSNNNQSSYFCSRPTPSTSRYNSNHPYSNVSKRLAG